jgi:DNA-binding MarR family transcriptional regulator
VVPSAREVAEEVGRLYPAVYRRFKAPTRGVNGADVTPRMLTVLRHLAGSGPLTVSEQAEHLGLTKATVSELVDRLAGKGLVTRMRDDRDRRRVFVWLTPDGQSRVTAHPQVLGPDDLTRAVEAMRPADRAALVRGLRALLATETKATETKATETKATETKATETKATETKKKEEPR